MHILCCFVLSTPPRKQMQRMTHKGHHHMLHMVHYSHMKVVLRKMQPPILPCCISPSFCINRPLFLGRSLAPTIFRSDSHRIAHTHTSPNIQNWRWCFPQCRSHPPLLLLTAQTSWRRRTMKPPSPPSAIRLGMSTLLACVPLRYPLQVLKMLLGKGGGPLCPLFPRHILETASSPWENSLLSLVSRQHVALIICNKLHGLVLNLMSNMFKQSTWKQYMSFYFDMSYIFPGRPIFNIVLFLWSFWAKESCAT